MPLAGTSIFKSFSPRQYKNFVIDIFAKNIELISLLLVEQIHDPISAWELRKNVLIRFNVLIHFETLIGVLMRDRCPRKNWTLCLKIT